MCGVAGFFNASETTETLKSMISQLRHRGPDGFGCFHRNNTGLAHARLSIIDLAGGFQPIHNEDETVWVVFNGEIFNYIELRDILEERGHRFYTTSDTEVIVHAYEEFGTSAFRLFNGQFAFALWDEKKETGYLVRDRVGIQPLFYALKDGLYFGSEIKSLLTVSGLNKGLNKEQLANVLTFWTTAPGQTVFNGIFELHSGHYIEFSSKDKFHIVEYWNHHYRTMNIGKPEEVFNDIKDSTEIRLRSDVPVGAYLSGGLDSTITVSMVKKYFNNDLRTFSIEFEDKQFDESEYQQAVVKELGVNHTSFKCTNEDVADAFEKVIYHTEKPILRTAPVPMYLLSKRVREEGYKVVLTGEGADEVFAGYDIFRENYVRRYIRTHGDTEQSRNLLLQLYPWMGDRISKSSAFLKQFFDSDVPLHFDCFSHEPRWRTTSKTNKFFAEGMPSPLMMEEFAMMFNVPVEATPLQRAQYLEFHTLFNGYLISSQGDRMLMANGVEGRFPFLDPMVINNANERHDSDKLKGMNEKHILKQMARGLIPDIVLNRKKQPYMAPDGQCFVGDRCPEYVNDVLSPESLKNFGYFDPKKVQILRKKFDKGIAKGFSDNMTFIGILSTQLLHNTFVDNFVPQQTASDDQFIVNIKG